MARTTRRRRTAGSVRSRRSKSEREGLARQFLRSTFYYLKGEQFIAASAWLLCKAG